MAFGGQLFVATGNQEPLTITEAIVTSERIFVEWTRGQQVGHLEATSIDGVVFRGEYHEPIDGPPGTCELTLYKSLHEYLLFGAWVHTPSAQRGTWAFRLQTDVVRANRTPLSKPQPSPATQPSPVAQQSPAAKPSPSTPPSPTAEPRREKLPPAVQVEMTTPSGKSLSDRLFKSRPAKPVASEVPAAAAVDRAKPAPPAPKPSPASMPAPVVVIKPAPPAPAPMFSNQLDHLLTMTAAEFAARDPEELEATLKAAPSSALFKLSRGAEALELKALAAAVISQQSSVPAAKPAVPTSEPILDSKSMKAQKRRSSKHWK